MVTHLSERLTDHVTPTSPYLRGIVYGMVYIDSMSSPPVEPKKLEESSTVLSPAIYLSIYVACP
jgi:hypothetical protein